MTIENGHYLGGAVEFSSEMQKVKEKIDFAESLHDFRDPEGQIPVLSEEIAGGAYPVIYSNHTHHVNIAALRGVYNRLALRPDNWYVAVAYSLDQGDQGQGLADFTNTLKPILENEDTHLIPLARSKDVKKYKEEKDYDSARKLVAVTRENQQRILNTVSQDAGFIFFPEATTEGGIRGQDGQRKGMQRVDNKMFFDLVDEAGRVGRTLAFLPVGIVDANKIVEPRKTDPTLRAKLQFAKTKLGLQPSRLASVNIGRVFGNNDIEAEGVNPEDPYSLNSFMMKKVAELLPEDARGVYR